MSRGHTTWQIGEWYILEEKITKYQKAIEIIHSQVDLTKDLVQYLLDDEIIDLIELVDTESVKHLRTINKNLVNIEKYLADILEKGIN